MRDEILAVRPELVDGRGEFMLRDLMARLNPDKQVRRRWAVEKALARMSDASAGAPDIERIRTGIYRLLHMAQSRGHATTARGLLRS